MPTPPPPPTSHPTWWKPSNDASYFWKKIQTSNHGLPIWLFLFSAGSLFSADSLLRATVELQAGCGENSETKAVCNHCTCVLPRGLDYSRKAQYQEQWKVTFLWLCLRVFISFHNNSSVVLWQFRIFQILALNLIPLLLAARASLPNS